MPITYIWNIAQMDCCPEINGNSNVVFTVHWIINATDGTHNSNTYGTVSVSSDSDGPFTLYEDLTLSQVVGWVQNVMGEEEVNRLQVALSGLISDQANPPVVTPALPWI